MSPTGSRGHLQGAVRGQVLIDSVGDTVVGTLKAGRLMALSQSTLSSLDRTGGSVCSVLANRCFQISQGSRWPITDTDHPPREKPGGLCWQLKLEVADLPLVGSADPCFL